MYLFIFILIKDIQIRPILCRQSVESIVGVEAVAGTVEDDDGGQGW